MADETVTTAALTMHGVLSDKAQKVVNRLAKTPGLEALASDNPFIDLIRDVFKDLLPVLIGCFGSAAKAVAALKRPGPLVKVRVRMTVRDFLRDDKEANDLLFQPLVTAILEEAAVTTVEEFKVLMERGA